VLIPEGREKMMTKKMFSARFSFNHLNARKCNFVIIIPI